MSQVKPKHFSGPNSHLSFALIGYGIEHSLSKLEKLSKGRAKLRVNIIIRSTPSETWGG
jgi:hypothetical protein